MIKVYCNGTHIQCLRRGELNVGMAGAPVEFDFSSEWDGLGKTAVFRCDGAKDQILGADGKTTVPPEILTTPGMDVEVGVYAVKEDGTTWPAPTTYCKIGRVGEGADPSGDESYPPTPSVGEQAVAAASKALALAQEAKESADSSVKSVNGVKPDANGNVNVAGGGDSSGDGTTIELDPTLSQSGKAADAKAVGDALANCVMVEEIDQEGGQGEFIPLLSADGTEYRFYIGNDGIPAVMDVNGRVVWTGTSGGSGGESGGESGGDTDVGWVDGETVFLTESMIIAGEYIDLLTGAFKADSWSRTDYIYCAGAAQLKLAGSKTSWHASDQYNAFYDIEKKFIGTFKNGLNSSNPNYIDIPEGACYFALSYAPTNLTAMNYTLYDTVQDEEESGGGGDSGNTGGESGGDTGGDTTNNWVDGEKVSPTLVEGEYVNNTNGSFVAYNGWNRTDYIYCAGADTLELSGDRDSWSASDRFNAFYDAEKNFVKAFNNGLSTSNPSRIKIPEGACYFVLSGGSDEMSAMNYTLRKEASIESWVNGETVHITEAVLIAGESVNKTTGEFVTDAWSRTVYINCAGAAQLKLAGSKTSWHASDGYNAFYGMGKGFIGAFNSGLGGSNPNYIDIPDGACYFVLSYVPDHLTAMNYTLYDTAQEVTG